MRPNGTRIERFDTSALGRIPPRRVRLFDSVIRSGSKMRCRPISRTVESQRLCNCADSSPDTVVGLSTISLLFLDSPGDSAELVNARSTGHRLVWRSGSVGTDVRGRPWCVPRSRSLMPRVRSYRSTATDRRGVIDKLPSIGAPQCPTIARPRRTPTAKVQLPRASSDGG